ncbi:MAG: MATE family efflux transporter [Gammaproteobacteria bacterium]|nr:MATE family efflux transporter [Gammaproteobacteria bacterium]
MTKPLSTLTEGSVRHHLVVMTIPMIWGILAIMSMYLADTYFVGQLGPRELAALSFTFPVVMVVVSLSIGLSAGTSSVLARAVGEHDNQKVRRLTTDSLSLSLVLVVIVSAVGIATIDPLFRWLGATEDLLPLIHDYMELWYVGMVFLVVPMTGMGALRATGDSKTPGFVMTAAAIVNLVLDPLLIFGLAGLPRMELTGAAAATVIARAVTFVITLWGLKFKLNVITFARVTIAEVLASWSRIMHVGLPATGTNIIIPVANGIAVAMISQYGPNAVAGFGVATRVESLALVIFYAMSAVIGPIVGQNLGAGKLERISEAMRLSMIFCVTLGLALALVLGLGAKPIASLFTDEPAVIAVATDYLWIVPISFGAAAVVMIVNAAFNGLGKPIPAVIVSVTRMIVLFLPLAFLGGRWFGVSGIFAALSLATLIVGVGAYMWYQSEVVRLKANLQRAPTPVTDLM